MSMLFFMFFPRISIDAVKRANQNLPHEHIPKDVEKEKKQKRGKYMGLHPPYEPIAAKRRECTCILWNEVEVNVHRAKR